MLTLLGLAQSKTYYIKPSQTDRCSENEQPCQTLSEFAAENSNGSDVTVIMLRVIMVWTQICPFQVYRIWQ